MPRRFFVAVIITMALATQASAAQGSSAGTRQISPAAAAAGRLGVFEGVWTRDDLPAGTSLEDVCAWLGESRRHMVCRQRMMSAGTTREQMAVYSYRGSDKRYVLTVFLAGGQIWGYEGTPEGDRWVFSRVPERPDAPRFRQVLTPTANAIHFLEEMSEDGGPWRLTDPSEDYRYVRVRRE